MGYFHPEALTVSSVGSLVVALVVGYLLFQVTKKLLNAILLSAVALALVVWHFEIVTWDEAKSTATRLEQQAEQGIDDWRKAGGMPPARP